MDRRQQCRAFLNRLGVRVWLVIIVAASAAGLSAQTPGSQDQAAPVRPEVAVPTPAGTATPWVQASPPASSAPPIPQNFQKQSNAKTNPSTVVAPPKPQLSPVPGASPKPSAAPSTAANQKPTASPTAQTQNVQASHGPTPTAAAEVKAKMLRERQRELSQPPGLEQQSILPDERDTFDKNELAYNQLQPEEKRALNQQARARIREETVDAYLKSGLKLNEDQLEVFALRYRQERRVLERRIQEEANRQRERRVPQIIEQLKREFGRLNAAPGAPKHADPSAPSLTPTPAPTPSATLSPAAAGNEATPPQGKLY